MRAFVGNQEAVDEHEFAELARGVDDFPDGFLPALFLGFVGESDEESEARRAAAEDILADLIEHSPDGMYTAYAKQVAAVTSLRKRSRGTRPGRMPKAA
ncbi:hypothetical protein ABZX85_35980 [Streptomyces sp. NPDC004539]|uniref:hypothetical protein n=1 Tax=Streptomyces sp. NPDC004539 TaxID=3154280 RepID=UPI0033ACF7C3